MASDTWQRHRTTETNDSEGHRKMEDGVMITAEETREDDRALAETQDYGDIRQG